MALGIFKRCFLECLTTGELDTRVGLAVVAVDDLASRRIVENDDGFLRRRFIWHVFLRLAEEQDYRGRVVETVITVERPGDLGALCCSDSHKLSGLGNAVISELRDVRFCDGL